jgi:hypothetical protein
MTIVKLSSTVHNGDGMADNPLIKKLRIKPNHKLAILNPPQDIWMPSASFQMRSKLNKRLKESTT